MPRRHQWAADGGRRCSLAEHFGVEPPDASASTPGVRREPGLEARLLQELLHRPAALGRHLRQEQAAPMSVLGHQAVTADHDRALRRAGSIDSSGPNTETSRESSGSSRGITRLEARILAGGVGGAARDVINKLAF